MDAQTSKSTPGSWKATGANVFAGTDCIAVCDTDNAPMARMEANARLMAAAPALREALAEMLETHSMENIGVHASARRIKAKERARAAIAASHAATSNPDVADSFTDPTKAGTVFYDHSCYRCDSGNKPCIKGKGRERDCDTLHARND